MPHMQYRGAFPSSGSYEPCMSRRLFLPVSGEQSEDSSEVDSEEKQTEVGSWLPGGWIARQESQLRDRLWNTGRNWKGSK
jgi:hypothetical protein